MIIFTNVVIIILFIETLFLEKKETKSKQKNQQIL